MAGRGTPEPWRVVCGPGAWVDPATDVLGPGGRLDPGPADSGVVAAGLGVASPGLVAADVGERPGFAVVASDDGLEPGETVAGAAAVVPAGPIPAVVPASGLVPAAGPEAVVAPAGLLASNGARLAAPPAGVVIPAIMPVTWGGFGGATVESGSPFKPFSTTSRHACGTRKNSTVLFFIYYSTLVDCFCGKYFGCFVGPGNLPLQPFGAPNANTYSFNTIDKNMDMMVV